MGGWGGDETPFTSRPLRPLTRTRITFEINPYCKLAKYTYMENDQRVLLCLRCCLKGTIMLNISYAGGKCNSRKACKNVDLTAAGSIYCLLKYDLCLALNANVATYRAHLQYADATFLRCACTIHAARRQKRFRGLIHFHRENTGRGRDTLRLHLYKQCLKDVKCHLTFM